MRKPLLGLVLFLTAFTGFAQEKEQSHADTG